MIDMHSHVLPQVDDGSRSIEETIELLKEAKKFGFDTVIATPHYVEGYFEKDHSDIKLIRKAVKMALKNDNIKLNLKIGNELYFSENMVHLLREKKASSINNSKYVLFEFPINEEPKDIYEYIYLLQENYYIPILAHPERYKFVQKNPEIVNDLVERGVLIQSNYGSILGYYGKKAKLLVEKFLECNLVHFLGSDVHRKNTIYPIIPDAMKKIKKITGKKNFEIITNINPIKAIQNMDIEIFEPKKIKVSVIDKMILKN